MSVPPDSPFFVYYKTDKFAFYSRFFYSLQGIDSKTRSCFIQLRDPTKARFEWVGGLINIISIEAIALFQSKRIACTETNRFDTKFFTGFENCIPYCCSNCCIGREINFNAKFAGIAGARDYHIDTG